MNENIIFRGKAGDIDKWIKLTINSHPNWTLKEYMEETHDKDMDL